MTNQHSKFDTYIYIYIYIYKTFLHNLSDTFPDCFYLALIYGVLFGMYSVFFLCGILFDSTTIDSVIFFRHIGPDIVCDILFFSLSDIQYILACLRHSIWHATSLKDFLTSILAKTIGLKLATAPHLARARGKTIENQVPTTNYPPVNKHRPWQIGVGRLVSTKNGLFSGSMLIYQSVSH